MVDHRHPLSDDPSAMAPEILLIGQECRMGRSQPAGWVEERNPAQTEHAGLRRVWPFRHIL